MRSIRGLNRILLTDCYMQTIGSSAKGDWRRREARIAESCGQVQFDLSFTRLHSLPSGVRGTAARRAGSELANHGT